MNVYYYAKSYLRGNIYYMGCLVSYMTMKGKRRPKKKKPQPEGEGLQESLLNQQEIAEKERQEKFKQVRRKNKKRKAAKLMGNIALVGGLIFMTLDTLALHYYFQWGRPSKKDVSLFNHVMFITFGKVIFVVSFMAILMPIAAKYKAFGNFIAQNRLLQLIGNVSFCGYLYHFTVIMLRINSQSVMPTYTFYDLFGAWCSDLFYTLILATLSCLLIELPVQNMWKTRIEKKLMNRLKAYVNPTSKAAHQLRSENFPHPKKQKTEVSPEQNTEPENQTSGTGEENDTDTIETGSKIAGSEEKTGDNLAETTA